MNRVRPLSTIWQTDLARVSMCGLPHLDLILSVLVPRSVSRTPLRRPKPVHTNVPCEPKSTDIKDDEVHMVL